MDEYTGIYNRLIEIFGCKTDSELADRLQVSRQALSNFKRGNTWPKARLVKVCEEQGINKDWLLLGEGLKFIKDLKNEREAKLKTVKQALESNPKLLDLIYECISSGFIIKKDIK